MKKLRICILVILALLLLGCGSKTAITKLPDITDPMVDYAVDLIMEYRGVRDAAVSIKENTIYMVIIADYSTSKEYAKDLGDSFIRTLGSKAAMDNKGLSGPSKDSFGSLYDYYDVQVQVAGPDQKAIALGVKSRNGKNIRW